MGESLISISMKKLLTIIFILITCDAVCQNQFNTLVNRDYDVLPYDLVEYNSSYYVLSSIKNENTGQNCSLIYKLNINGILVDSLVISSEEINYELQNIAVFNNNILLTGFTSAINEYNICILELSEELEIQQQFQYPYEFYYYTNCCTSINGNNFMLAAGVQKSTLDMLFIKFNNQYEIEKDTIIDTSAGDIPFDIITNHDKVLISVQGEGLKRVEHQLWQLHDDFSISLVTDFNGILFSTIVFDNENRLLSCGEKYRLVNGETEDYIANYRFEDGIGFTDSISIGIDFKRDHVSRRKSIAATDEHIFILFSRNIDMGIIDWFVPHEVKACLYTLDYDFNIINETYLDDEACYNTCNLKTTSDGGCIFLSSRYDYQAGIQEKDIVVVKTDSNGIFTWTTEIPLPDLPNGIYPNPANEYIHIKDQFIPGTLQIFDMNGKQVREAEAKSAVDISNLASGNYVYRIFDEKGMVSSVGKMVVE